MTTGHTDDFDEAIKRLEDRIAQKQMEERAEQEAHDQREPHGPGHLASQVFQHLSQSGLAPTMLAQPLMHLGMRALGAIRKDFQQNPRRLVLKSVIGAIIAGSIINSIAKRKNS